MSLHLDNLPITISRIKIHNHVKNNAFTAWECKLHTPPLYYFTLVFPSLDLQAHLIPAYPPMKPLLLIWEDVLFVALAGVWARCSRRRLSISRKSVTKWFCKQHCHQECASVYNSQSWQIIKVTVFITELTVLFCMICRTINSSTVIHFSTRVPKFPQCYSLISKASRLPFCWAEAPAPAAASNRASKPAMSCCCCWLS